MSKAVNPLDFYLLISIFGLMGLSIILTIMYVFNILGIKNKVQDIIFQMRLKIYILVKYGSGYKKIAYLRLKKGTKTFSYNNKSYYIDLNLAVQGQDYLMNLNSEPPTLYYDVDNCFPLNLQNSFIESKLTIITQDQTDKTIKRTKSIIRHIMINSSDFEQQLKSSKYSKLYETKQEKTYIIIIVIMFIALIGITLYFSNQKVEMEKQLIELLKTIKK